MMKRFISIFLLSTLTLFAASDYQVENFPHVIEKAIQFEHKGMLKQKDNGYLYIEVLKEFIAELLPLINVQGKIVPPRHYTSEKGIGAHISVMYENEQILNEIWMIHELGQTFPFAVKELRTVKISKDNKARKLWLLAVSAPELEKLRAKYGLAPLLKGHDFHITIGTQIPGKQSEITLEEFEVFQEAA